MTEKRPAFYAPSGSPLGDLVAILHPPYTAWHLGYVAIGAAAAPSVDAWRLVGTLVAFFFGTGLAAHALDEWKDRPLGTTLGDRTLLAIGVGGFVAASIVAVAGIFVISPWVIAWALAGILLAAGYVLEWNPTLHSDVGFGLTWSAFPVLVGYWAQAETIHWSAVLLAAAATLFSLSQRALSTPARFLRRRVVDSTLHLQLEDGTEEWDRQTLLATWERPLKYLAAAVVLLAAGLLAIRL